VEAQLPVLEEQQARLSNAIALLLGEQPGARLASLAVPRAAPVVPPRVPVGVPGDLTRRRPDIRMAEAHLHAATAGIGVATADFYPRVTLSGFGAIQGLNVSNLREGAALARAYRGADVMVFPSRTDTFGLVLLEAMASGTACVATDAGADGEVLEGGAGIVISTQGVTTQLRTLLPVLRDQPVLTAELGRRARARALERYTLERNIDQLELLYAGLVPQATLAGL
jgi:glycosyltransferase involved in cell wall biosynthesis